MSYPDTAAHRGATRSASYPTSRHHSERPSSHRYPRPTPPDHPGTAPTWHPPARPMASPTSAPAHQLGEDADLARALELSHSVYEIEAAERRSREEAEDRRAGEEYEAQQMRQLEAREREERELAEAMRQSRIDDERLRNGPDPELDLALAMSLSLADAQPVIDAPVASTSRLPPVVPRPSVREEMSTVLERRRQVDEQRRVESQRRLDLDRARTTTSTTASVGVGPRDARPQSLRTAHPFPSRTSSTRSTLPPPYDETAYPTSSTPATVPPGPAPAPASVPVILRPLPDLPKPTMLEVRPANRPPLFAPGTGLPSDDDARSFVPSMPSLPDDDDDPAPADDPFGDSNAAPSNARRREAMDLWARLSHVLFDDDADDGEPLAAADEEEDEGVREALDRARRPSNTSLGPSSDEASVPPTPWSSPMRPSRPAPALPPSPPATPPPPRRVVVGDRLPGFMKNPPASADLTENVSYGWPFLSSDQASPTGRLPHRGSFPDVVTLSRHPASSAGGSTAVFAIEAPTWNRLLTYCMWHGNSRLEGAPLDVAGSSVPLEMAVTVRFINRPDAGPLPFVRLLLELAPLNPAPPSPSSLSRDPTQLRSRRPDPGTANAKLNQTVPIPKPYVALPLTMSAFGASLHEVHKVARMVACSPYSLFATTTRPTVNGRQLYRLAKAIEANADAHGEGKTITVAQEGETLIRRGKRWLKRQGMGLLGASGGGSLRRVAGDGLPVPESFITPFDFHWG